MKRIVYMLFSLLFLTACSAMPQESSPTRKTQTAEVPAQEVQRSEPPQPPADTVPYFIEGVSVDEVLEYFKEVCLDSEYAPTGDGNPSLVQRWESPIYYTVSGTPTEEDIAVIESMAQQLETIENFPGFYPAHGRRANVEIRFCGTEEMLDFLGDAFTEANTGGVRFWYTNDVIYKGIICCRNDTVPQTERNSIIKEEIYGLLGPVQDTTVRSDSIIYQYSDTNLELSEMDVLLLRLLYHPEIRCSMNYDECAEVIREIYQPSV